MQLSELFSGRQIDLIWHEIIRLKNLSFSLIDDDAARELADTELSKLKYHLQESILERLLKWIFALFERWFVTPDGDISATGIITAIAALIFAILTAILVIRFGANWRRTTKKAINSENQATLFDDNRDSSSLFAAAETALSSGNLQLALVEKFRGIIRKSEELGYLQIYPGMTASEAALIGSKTLGNPLLFTESANWFNKVYYGLKTPDNEAIAVVSSLQQHVVNTPKLETKNRTTVTLGGIPVQELQQ
ncbi:MAG: hypothetical protein SPG61_07625 [Arcanobacterium sp.]|nr:hypothetical protein [Arcanobacterium sp.]